jgi:hypothetical protein
MQRNTYDELLTKFTPKELKERLEELNSELAKMLMIDDMQTVIREKQDIEFILGLNEQTK